MITDRRRAAGDWEPALVERVGAAARAGVHLIQVRERDLDTRALRRLVERCVRAVEGTTARIVVNDRLDVALAAGAHGVHLRGDSVPGVRARAIAGRALLVGRSVHGREEAERAAGGLDYVMCGPVFETATKPGAPAAGPGWLTGVVASSTIPVLAVGGVTVERVAEVAGAGAAGFAAIGLFASCPLDALEVIVRTASTMFDTPGSVP
jgi:thiamine-phosphate pyrophosphorylase